MNQQPTQNKRIIEFLKTLPEPYNEKAIKNYAPSFYEQGMLIENNNDALGWAFDWSTSPEGEEYWMALRRHLENGEPLPKREMEQNNPLICPQCRYTEDIRTKPVTHDCMKCGYTWETVSPPSISETEFKDKVAEILKDNVWFSPQTSDYVIHGALDKIWELHTQSSVPDSSHAWEEKPVPLPVTALDLIGWGRNKPFFIDTFRKLLGQYDNDEISISKLVEELNITALRWHRKQTPQPAAVTEDWKERAEPIPLKAGDKRVLVNGRPLLVDFRIVSEGRWEELQKEIAELKDWKAQALKVMPDFQKLGRLLNIPLGASVSDNLIPAIENLLNRDKLGNVGGEEETREEVYHLLNNGGYGLTASKAHKLQLDLCRMFSITAKQVDKK